MEEHCKTVDNMRKERMCRVSLQDEQVAIRHNGYGRRNGADMKYCGVVHPCFTGVSETSLQRPPFIPFEYTIASQEQEQKNKQNQDNSADLCYLHEIPFK